MSISEKQLAANRANGRKSTGPRTPEGKAAASMNAVRHGCFARTLLLPSEDPAQFEAFAAGLLDDLRPEGPLETDIATRLVATAWRLRRVPVAEAAIFSPDPIPTAPPPAPANHSAPSRWHGHPARDSSLASNPRSTAPQSTGSNGFVSRNSSDPSYRSDPPDNLSSASHATNPGAHYLRRLRPGADPLAGISRHEARLHRQFDRDLQLFESARKLRFKREREDRERALRRAQDPNDPLYDPAMDPYVELRRRRLARRLRPANRPSAPLPPSPHAVADQPAGENGFVSADPAGWHGLPARGSSQPSRENGFVSRKSARLPEILDALYHHQLRIERQLGLPETNEEVQALV